MNRFAFKRLYSDLTVRVKEEGKTNPSWLVGFLQGHANRKLSGYQCAALLDLLFVHPDEPEPVGSPAQEVPAVPVKKYPDNMKAVAGAAITRP